MDYELKKPIQVMNKDEGEYQAQKIILVEFKGKKGLSVLKRLQDTIFKTFAQQSKDSKTVVKKSEDQSVVTIDEVLSLLDMTGASEKLFDEVTGALRAFATIGGVKLDDNLQDELTHEDLDGLYQEVLKHFLLPKITSKMNSMSK